MVPSRRTLLRSAAAAGLTAVAGCAALPSFGTDDAGPEYTLTADRIDASPVEHALYEPDEDDPLFGAPARTALDSILPDGRYTTYGYESLPAGAYVRHDGIYYRTESVVTGRERMTRPLVRVEEVAEESVPEDAVLVDDLDRPSARVVKILHANAQTDGESGSADLLRGEAYVLRRPAELESRLASDDFDGRVVTMTESDTWAYRVRVTRRPILETAYTALAIEVADSESAFREVVFGSRIDAELAPGDLAGDAREVLERCLSRGRHAETAPLSPGFDAVLEALGVDTVETAATGRLLWYDGELYRYGLYVDEGE
ncbi:hypothetical protein [Halobellus rubicundus]|uniref:Twin-arginine translocation signal domain-containing protein n=1 Tax=Halobellus rubicundus TaxID=2996466 RepID=A0ABD5MIL0_9EURY